MTPKGEAGDRKVHLIVFTDLDGTLLDFETYSHRGTEPALARIRSTKTPLIFCSSKTRAEQEVYRRELGVPDPFIVENGGAVFIPKGYFPFDYDIDLSVAAYEVLEMGIPYSKIREHLSEVLRDLDIHVLGYGDMSPEEVARETGLSTEAAARAMDREYTETLVTRI
jgi:mannosyl-3-phosphoglycerate phosphatase